MDINKIANNDPSRKLNKGNFELEKVAESLVQDIDVSVLRDFKMLSKILTDKSKSAVDLFFNNIDTDTLH